MLLACCLIGGTLSGCGGKTENSTESSQASAETAKTEQEDTSGEKEQPENITIEFFNQKQEEAAQQAYRNAAEDFHKEYPYITIEINTVPDSDKVLTARMAADDVPVVFHGKPTSQAFFESAEAGFCLDLSDQPFIQNAIPSILESVKSEDGKVYAMPYSQNFMGVFYNVDIFKEHNLDIPKTWDEFMALCQKLEDAGITPFEFTFADSWTCLPPWNSMAPVIPAADFTDQRKEGKTTFVGTHEEILEKYLSLLDHAQDDFMGTTYTDGNAAFANGSAAMMINGNWAISEFLNTNPDMNVNMFAFPSVDDESKNTVTSGVDVLFAVSNQGSEEQQEAAKEFIRYALTKDVAQEYIDDQFAFSAVNGVEQQNETVSGVAKDIANGKVSNFPDHYYPNGFDLSTILQQFALNKVNGMDDTENISETLASCDEQYDAANVE